MMTIPYSAYYSSIPATGGAIGFKRFVYLRQQRACHNFVSESPLDRSGYAVQLFGESACCRARCAETMRPRRYISLASHCCISPLSYSAGPGRKSAVIGSCRVFGVPASAGVAEINATARLKAITPNTGARRVEHGCCQEKGKVEEMLSVISEGTLLTLPVGIRRKKQSLEAVI
jgi:hypothetical protein